MQPNQMVNLLLGHQMQPLFAGSTTMGGNHETPMFQSTDALKMNVPSMDQKVELNGWNNQMQQVPNAHSGGGHSLHSKNSSGPKAYNMQLYNSLKQTIQAKELA
jgi:hypothetical protein